MRLTFVTSFFWMNFAPGGTNFPHHHETAEEIYLVLDGNGEMAAGSGLDVSKDDFRPKQATRTISAPTARLASTIKTNQGRKRISWQCVRGFPYLKTSIKPLVPIRGVHSNG